MSANHSHRAHRHSSSAKGSGVFWNWATGLMCVPTVVLVLWGLWAIEAEKRALLREVTVRAEAVAEGVAQLGLPRAAARVVVELPVVEDGVFFYPAVPVPQGENEAQRLFAEGQFERLLDGEFSGQLSAAGLPLGPLAAFAIWRGTTNPEQRLAVAERVCEMAVERHPSAITERLLDDVMQQEKEARRLTHDLRIVRLYEYWRRDEYARRVLRERSSDILKQVGPCWYPASDVEKRTQPQPEWGTDAVSDLWVAPLGRDESGSRRRIIVLRELQLRRAMQPAFDELLKSVVIPETTTIQLLAGDIELAGRSAWETSDQKDGLASNDAVRNGRQIVTIKEGGKRNFGVRVFCDEQRLYERLIPFQRRVGATVLLGVVATGLGLWQARRAARRQSDLVEQKDNFLSSVSHELRSPVASVRLMAEGLANGTVRDEAERQTFHELMLHESQRLSGLVENLLDFARMEQDRKVYSLAETDLAALVTDTVRSQEPLAARSSVTLQVETIPLEARVDSLAIQQALVNLIDNAVKFSPQGGVVRIKLTESGPAWHLTVADDGPGVPMDERKKVFERFYRVGSELRRTTTGAGIGLSIVKHIVEGHVGRVWIDGEQGAVFHIQGAKGC